MPLQVAKEKIGQSDKPDGVKKLDLKRVGQSSVNVSLNYSIFLLNARTNLAGMVIVLC